MTLVQRGTEKKDWFTGKGNWEEGEEMSPLPQSGNSVGKAVYLNGCQGGEMHQLKGGKEKGEKEK